MVRESREVSVEEENPGNQEGDGDEEEGEGAEEERREGGEDGRFSLYQTPADTHIAR